MPPRSRTRVAWISLTAALGVAIGLSIRTGPHAGSTQPPPTDDAPMAPTDAAPGTTPDAGTPLCPSGSTTRIDATPRQPRLIGRLVQAGRPLAGVTLQLATNRGYVPTASDRTVTTDAHGTFATTGLPTTFWFTADAATVPAEWQSGPIAPLDDDVDVGDVEPPLAIDLDVQVVDAVGRAVASPTCWFGRQDVHVNLDPSDLRAAKVVHGDADGKLRLTRLHPGQTHLKVTADGFAMAKMDVDLDGTAPPAPLRITLSRGGQIAGQVFDWRDQPLPGASVNCEGVTVTTDDTGSFLLRPFGGVEMVCIEAPGHLRSWMQGERADSLAHIRLQRTATLRGVVHGGNATTSIVLAEAPRRGRDLPWPGPSERMLHPLPVAADGTFAIEGLHVSDYVVHARAEGLGGSRSRTVELRDDTSIELTIEPAASIALRVVDGAGQPVAPIEVVCNLTILEYESLFGPHGTDIPARVFDSWRRVDLPAHGDEARIAAPPDAPLVLGVRARGYLPAIRVFAAGAAPAQCTVELERAGALRGIVHGGRDRAYARTVALWLRDADAEVRAGKQNPRHISIDAKGRLRVEAIAPGDYFATLSRTNRACIGHRPHEQFGAVALVDEWPEPHRVAFAITGGSTTEIELHDAPLGTVRGRVLQAGHPVADVWVVAARPGAKSLLGFGDHEPVDWNDAVDLKYRAGQCTAADGTFVFLYRDAGPVELRVRHRDGAGTMAPRVVELPPPGPDVPCDLELALGSVRGRFVADPAAATAEPGFRPREAVLFPLADAAADPFFSTEWALPVRARCKSCDLGTDGAFAFTHVPDGDWVVRVTDGFRNCFAHRLVTVQGAEVDVGELRATTTVTARISWAWPAGTAPRSSYGIWLYEPRAGRPALWVGTFGGDNDGAACTATPGNYLGVVFGGFGDQEHWGWAGSSSLWGISGTPLSEPFAVEIRADGSAHPTRIALPALAPPTARNK